jgi:putative lipoic acid-binding regulatory protein
MNMIKPKYLKTGWNDPEFESKIIETIKSFAEEDYEYYDIKISSKDNHCLILFRKREVNIFNELCR